MSKCKHPYHSYYPYYGVGPHLCYYRKPGGSSDALGTSDVSPVESWPNNFLLDAEGGVSLSNPCGIWYCPDCLAGMSEDLKSSMHLLHRTEVLQHTKGAL